MPMSESRTYSGAKLEPAIAPQLAVEDAAALAAGTYARGTVLGQVTASGRFRAYAAGNSDGSQTARAVLAVACTVDAQGNVTLGDAVDGGEHGEEHLTAPVYLGGYFRTTDLVDLDAGAVTALGKIVRGTLAAGILRIT